MCRISLILTSLNATKGNHSGPQPVMKFYNASIVFWNLLNKSKLNSKLLGGANRATVLLMLN